MRNTDSTEFRPEDRLIRSIDFFDHAPHYYRVLSAKLRRPPLYRRIPSLSLAALISLIVSGYNCNRGFIEKQMDELAIINSEF